MIYTVGYESTADFKYPADTLQTMTRDKGLGTTVETIMAQLRNVTGIDIEDCDWARIQPWTSGVSSYLIDHCPSLSL